MICQDLISCYRGSGAKCSISGAGKLILVTRFWREVNLRGVRQCRCAMAEHMVRAKHKRVICSCPHGTMTLANFQRQEKEVTLMLWVLTFPHVNCNFGVSEGFPSTLPNPLLANSVTVRSPLISPISPNTTLTFICHFEKCKFLKLPCFRNLPFENHWHAKRRRPPQDGRILFLSASLRGPSVVRFPKG